MQQIMFNRKYRVLMGDMNAEPNAEELSPLFDWFQDSWDLNGDALGYTFPSTAPVKRIDYIFSSKRMQVNAARIVPSEASDHIPVIADITMAAGNHSLSVAGMQYLVKVFTQNGDITNEISAHRLQLHLSAVQFYEKNKMYDKAIKHLNNLEVLLANLQKQKNISTEAKETLNTDADYLMDKWRSIEMPS